MADVDSAPEQSGGDEAAIESILGKLGDFDDEGAAVEQKSEGEQPEDAVTEKDDGEAQDQSEVDTEETPAIEPPPGLTDDEKEAFKSLPPNAQEMIARRERDRTTELRRGQDEIANQKKAVEQERLRLAQTAENYIQLATSIDPILADGVQTDWAKLAQEDPALYVQKWAAYQQRYAQVQAAISERQAQTEKQNREVLAREQTALNDKLPEWKDAAKQKAIKGEVLSALTDRYGFTKDELKGLTDHRTFLVARDAALYHKLMAERKSVADKKVVPITKVQKPGAGSENLSSSERIKAMTQKAAKTDNLHDRAALIAAALD